ncbi:MAG: magnesium transporter CorA family protein [Acidimicrobiia bacterium]|nr:magnesium transporter CorA family protein [Acidimicrobiia bacterium]
MRTLFHIAPGAGSAVEVPVERLDAIRDAEGWLWLDITEFTHVDVAEIGSHFGLDALEVEDVLDWSKFPKVEERDDHTLIVGHGLSALADRLTTVEYDVFIGERFLVTFHTEDLPGFAWGRTHVLQAGVLNGSGPDLLWARIAEVGAAAFRPLVEGLDQRIAELEDRAVAAVPSVPGDVLALRRDSHTLGEMVAAQRDIFRILGREEYPGISRQGRRRLTHVYDDYSRLTRSLEAAPVLLGSVLESYRGTVAERANEVMKVLTVFSAIVLPLSLIAGVYGMNFAHMPELAWRWGYFGVIALMSVVGIGLWVYFGRRGFVGGPRLGAVPGLVGKGLVEFVKLTAKPATMLLDLAKDDTAEQPAVED